MSTSMWSAVAASPGHPGPAKLHSRHLPIRTFSGAGAARVTDNGNCTVEEHAHDWPVLSIFIAGEYRNCSDLGEISVRSPAVILYRRGDAHANRTGASGHDQIEIEFDPVWLGSAVDLDRPRAWIGGPVASSARRLIALWSKTHVPEQGLQAATQAFLTAAMAYKPQVPPAWLDEAFTALSSEEPPSTAELARRLDLTAAWLAQRYRAAVGEGVGDTVRRRRVERAVALLREENLPAAEIAVAAGFCDQSHMIRSFKAVLLRSPNLSDRLAHRPS